MKLTRNQIKEFVNDGIATDLTNATIEEINNARPLEKISLSHGSNGMNGGLFWNYKTEKLYAITARNTNLYMIA